MTDRELMQQALEALERCVATCFHAYAHEQVMSWPEHFVNQNITALRERLAQPEQEPVGYFKKDGGVWFNYYEDYPHPEELTPLYTTPPRREWVGLTDEEVEHGLLRSDYALQTAHAWRAGVVFAMAKLKEKNA